MVCENEMMYVVVIMYARIHQVRSHGNNVAVNVWWKHRVSLHDIDKCPHGGDDNVVDQSLTLDKLTLHSSDDVQSLRL